jgi:hypothetical protein
MSLFKKIIGLAALFVGRSNSAELANERNYIPVMKDPVGTTVCGRWEDIQKAIYERNYGIQLTDINDIVNNKTFLSQFQYKTKESKWDNKYSENESVKKRKKRKFK